MATNPTNPLLPQQSDTISDVFVRTWYLDNRVVGYVFSRITAADLETWSATIVQTLQAWPVTQPYLALYDLSSRGVALPYIVGTRHEVFSLGINDIAEETIREIIDQRPNFTARIAVIFNSAYSGNLGQVFARTRQASQNPRIQFNSFMDSKSALAWLTNLSPLNND